MRYVELHARSAFSFLRGGSDPEALARAAAHIELPAVALCDRGGVYGSVRLHMQARELGFRPLVGCEIQMEDETTVPVLVASQAGYRRLCDMLTTAHLRAAKGEGRVRWDELGTDNSGLIALTGDEDGPIRRAWTRRGTRAASEAGDRLLEIFGRERVYVEMQRHLVADEEEHNDFLLEWARARRLPLLATNGVTHAEPRARHVVDVFTCMREHVTLDEAGRRLARNAERFLKGDKAMKALFADVPDAIAHTEELAGRLEFTLDNLGYRFPDYPVPDNHDQDSYLKEMTIFGAHQRYGSFTGKVKRQLERELRLIAKLGFSGYFLIVWGICNYARQRGILVQGRGSAANSAVCYSLGITAVDPIGSKLLFERFLSEGRSDWPDIDLDLPSGDAREDVIQEVYRRYGRRGAAMTANVISMRGKSTMREVGKAFGMPKDILDRFSGLFHHGDYPETLRVKQQLRSAGYGGDDRQLDVLLETCRQVYALPRHLGQHSGGMVISAASLSNYVPLENASMPGRSVLQWDKSDIEDMKMIKIDLLGLGMMAVLSEAVEICERRGQPVDYARIPRDDAKAFEMARAADTVGVFQIESRAQMATLPRMKPENFYDLAIEVALIRPGPIQGDAVNPYLERRAGRQPVSYPDERARPILERTLGVVLFQEQVLQLAMELGGFTASEADELRRAIGFTRTSERMDKMKAKLREALLRNKVTQEATESIVVSLSSFALYGFPESHAISFALIAYSSLWLKAHHPAVFLAALLNNQPMGFYSLATLVQDAKRHGVKVLPPCVQVSDARSRVDDDATVRLGLRAIKGLRADMVEQMIAAREIQPFASLDDFLRRTRFNPNDRRALAAAGALNVFAGHRRAALWLVESQEIGDELFRWAAATNPVISDVPLAPMTLVERVRSDFVHLEMTTGAHPMALIRDQLFDVWAADELKGCANGQVVTIAGSVTCRQRPGTASGVVFVTLEDETGTCNAIVWPNIFERYRLVINLEPALMITGKLQHQEGVTHVIADMVEPLPALTVPVHSSHDYH